MTCPIGTLSLKSLVTVTFRPSFCSSAFAWSPVRPVSLGTVTGAGPLLITMAIGVCGLADVPASGAIEMTLPVGTVSL